MAADHDLRGVHLMFVTAVPTAAHRFMAPVAAAARDRGARTSLVLGAGCDLTRPDGFDEVHTIRAHRRRGPVRLRQASVDLARLARRERADLLHLHTPFSVALGRSAARTTEIPSISVIHGTPLDQSGLGSRLFRAVESRRAGMADRIIVLNEEDFAAYRQFAPDSSVVLAPGGGGGVALPPAAPATPRRRPPLALFLGRPAPGKNLGLLQEAWLEARRQIPDLRLRIVGGPSEGDRVPDPIDTPVLTLIPTDRDPLPELDAADLLVSASAREGFGMSVAEALVRGVPVACVTNRGARQIARGVAAGLVLTDPTAPALGAGMVAGLRERVVLRPGTVTKWSRPHVVAFHLDQIRATLEGSPSGAASPSRQVDGVR